MSINVLSKKSRFNEMDLQQIDSQTSDPLTFLSEICGTLKTLKRTGWVRSNIPLPESDSDHMHRCAMCTLLLSQPTSREDDYEANKNSKYHPSKVDQTKLLKMALTHDLCEALAGDITPFCSTELVNSKHEKERSSMLKISNLIGNPLGKELYDLWKEYEEQLTIEAIYCKDIDKFEMVMQAFEYEKKHLIKHEKKDSKDKGKSMLDENKNKKMKMDESASKHKCDTNAKVLHEPLRTFFITTNNCIKTPLFRRLDKELRNRREKWLNEYGWDITEQEQQK